MDDLQTRLRLLDQARSYDIGFPGATDQQFGALATLLTCFLINNVGDPWVDGIGDNHSKDAEREVVEFVARLLRGDPDDQWGYVTTGGTEGNLYALFLARELHPGAVVYYSRAAHPSIPKAIRLLGMESVCVLTDELTDVLDYNDLTDQLDRRRHRPAVVACTAGTTLMEAHDDVAEVRHILNTLAVRRSFVHVDAALSGIPLAVAADPADRPRFDLTDGADSITVSGHKFLGIPAPCGVVVTRDSYRRRIGGPAGYVGSPDDTISGSRSGHTALMLWDVIRRLGVDGLRKRALESWQLAEYTATRINALRWRVRRGPYSMTVALQTPPPSVLDRWKLARMGGWCHIVCVPGVQQVQIDAFVEDLADAIRTPARPAADAVSV